MGIGGTSSFYRRVAGTDPPLYSPSGSDPGAAEITSVIAAFANLAIWVLRRLGKWNGAWAMNGFKRRPNTAVGPTAAYTAAA